MSPNGSYSFYSLINKSCMFLSLANRRNVPRVSSTEESFDSFEPIGQSREFSENSEPIGQAVVQRTLRLSTLNFNNVCIKVRNDSNYWVTIGTCAFLLDIIAYG